jgi:hypothetical protein
MQLGAGRCQNIVKIFRNKEGEICTVYIGIHAIRKHKCKGGKNVIKCSFLFRITDSNWKMYSVTGRHY